MFNRNAQLDASVLMATRNRASILCDTLHAMTRLDVEGIDWEVIVVGNACEDETFQILKHASHKLPIRILSEPVPGKSRALNRAVRVARGRLLVFTDDDVIPDPNWLKALVHARRRWPEDSVFGGRIDPLFPACTPQWIIRRNREWAPLNFAAYRPAAREGPVEDTPYGPNYAVAAQLMERNLFCEVLGPQQGSYPMGQESEFLERLQRQGYRIIWVPQARVQHVVRPEQITMREIFRRAERLGRGWARERPMEHCAQFFGAPRWLWRRLGRLWLRYVLTPKFDQETRCGVGWPFYHFRGIVKEYRQIKRERRVTDSTR